jgi:hypothetical protein
MVAEALDTLDFYDDLQEAAEREAEKGERKK